MKHNVNFNLEVYSDTEEHIVGVWIDGRPIYRKVFKSKTNTTANTDKDIAVMDSDCADIIKIDGWIMETATNKLTLNFYSNSSTWARTNVKVENDLWRVKNKVSNQSWILGVDTICYVDYIKIGDTQYNYNSNLNGNEVSY